jgi:hypothetical protein
MGQPASATDRRAVERVPTSLRGKVFRASRDSLPLDCTIADYTRAGARLRFKTDPPPEARFIVVVWSSGLAFEAEARWRRGQEIGVCFVSSRDLRRPAPPHLAAAQALWRKRRPRFTRRSLVASPVILQTKRRRPRVQTPTA